MTLGARLRRWKEEQRLSPTQAETLTAIVERRVISVLPELSAAFYLGVVVLALGVGLTIRAYAAELGPLVIVSVLSLSVSACLFYCALHAPAWDRQRVLSPSLAFDYLLYLGALLFSAELGYLELQYHLLQERWDLYLLASALLFFALAYRFDNRFVLSLALSTLAAWFGIRLHGWLGLLDGRARGLAFAYGGVVAAAGLGLARARIKRHFLGTYLQVATNALLATAVSWVITDSSTPFLLISIALCAVAYRYGLGERAFSYLAYALLYGYVGVTAWLLGKRLLVGGVTGVLLYFLVSSTLLVLHLVSLARGLRREDG